MRVSRVAGAFGLLFLLEFARECYVLNLMGFEPGRFMTWVRGDDLVAR